MTNEGSRLRLRLETDADRQLHEAIALMRQAALERERAHRARVRRVVIAVVVGLVVLALGIWSLT